MLACGGERQPSLMIFAAASLEGALPEVVAAFQEKHPDLKIHCQFAGSQILSHQIREGAPADLFLSAHPDYLRGLEDQLAPARVFAGNSMVLAVSRNAFAEKPEPLQMASFALVMAGPEVPAGRYGRAALQKADLWPKWKTRLLSMEDSVVGVTTKLLAGEAEVGVMYGSEAAALSGERFWILPLPGPEESMRYSGALLQESPHRDKAEAFLDFLLSTEADGIFRARGLSP